MMSARKGEWVQPSEEQRRVREDVAGRAAHVQAHAVVRHQVRKRGHRYSPQDALLLSYARLKLTTTSL
jgi:hypothetical protein